MLLFSVVQIIAKGPEPHSPQPIECAAASTLDQHSFDAAWAADWNGTDGTLSSPASERDCFLVLGFKKAYQNWWNLFGRAKWPFTSQVFFPQLLFCFDKQSGSSCPREGPSWDSVDGMMEMCYQIQNCEFHKVHEFQTAGAKWPVQVQKYSQSFACSLTEILQVAPDRLVHDLLQDQNNEDPPSCDRRTMVKPHGLYCCWGICC